MKTFKNLLLILCVGLSLTACSNDNDSAGIPATEITNLAFSTFEGSITLTWQYENSENINRYVEIRYYDSVKQKDIKKVVSGLSNSFLLEGTSAEDGEYTFYVQPFSTTFTPGQIQTVSGTSTSKIKLESIPMTLTGENVLAMEDETGQYQIKSSGSLLFDGDLDKVLAYSWLVSEDPLYHIDILLPQEQTFLKFGYTIPAKSPFRAPAQLKCYVKATVSDEWTELVTLTAQNDGLPSQYSTEKYVEYTSGEYKSDTPFSYVRFEFEKVSELKNGVFTEEMIPRDPTLSEMVMYDVRVAEE